MQDNMLRVHHFMPPSMLDALDALVRPGETRSDLVRKAVEMYLKKEEANAIRTNTRGWSGAKRGAKRAGASRQATR